MSEALYAWLQVKAVDIVIAIPMLIALIIIYKVKYR